MNVCEPVSMFDGFAPPYTLVQWMNYSPHPTGRIHVCNDTDNSDLQTAFSSVIAHAIFLDLDFTIKYVLYKGLQMNKYISNHFLT